MPYIPIAKARGFTGIWYVNYLAVFSYGDLLFWAYLRLCSSLPALCVGLPGFRSVLIDYLRNFKFIFLHKKMLFILFILFRGHRKPVFMRFCDVLL